MAFWTAMTPTLYTIGAISVLLGMPARFASLARFLVCAIAAVLMARYGLWRTYHTMDTPNASLESLWQWTFYLAEVPTIVSGMVALLTLSRTKDRSAEASDNQNWLAAGNHSIDILIATYNEEHAILERTIIGAKRQDYPNFRVFVLDDGNRPWLADLCGELDVFYLTRTENSHAKSGNMNHAVRYLTENGGLSDFIAVLDADFIAQPDFLRRAAALFRDPTVGVVQTPQNFFNLDPIQHAFGSGAVLPDEQRFFFDTVLPSRDAWGTAFCCGTSSICRREALLDIGGFPTESVTEDMLLSIKMKTRGWRTVYLSEKLSYGLAPEGLSEYITQRGRWCIGFMQIFVGEWGPFRDNNLGVIDRMGLIDTFLFWATSYPFKLLCLLVPTVYWLTGATAVVASTDDLMSYMVPCALSQVVVFAALSKGRILPVLTDASQLLVTIDIMRAATIGLLYPKNQKFKVTDKGGNRDTLRIHWHILRRFLTLAAIMVGAMIYAYCADVVDFRSEASRIILFWSYYAFIVLIVAAIICIELPRPREEVFDCREDVKAFTGARELTLSVRRLSLSGAVAGATEALPAAISLLFAGIDGEVEATVTRQDAARTELELRLTGSQRRQMIAKIFSQAYIERPEALNSMSIYARLAQGLFLRPSAG